MGHVQLLFQSLPDWYISHIHRLSIYQPYCLPIALVFARSVAGRSLHGSARLAISTLLQSFGAAQRTLSDGYGGTWVILWWWLWMVMDGHGWWWMVMDGYGWLWWNSDNWVDTSQRPFFLTQLIRGIPRSISSFGCLWQRCVRWQYVTIQASRLGVSILGFGIIQNSDYLD